MSRIEWTEQTWNPVRGCSRVSPGCEHCYAERMAIRLSGPGRPYEGLVRSTPGGPRWTGRVELDVEKLAEPATWLKPRRVFVNSMSDLFHEELPDAAIVEVLHAVADAPQHTFQVLTKRAVRMRRFFQAHAALAALPNLWLGVSVEHPKEWPRLFNLSRVPAPTRFVSVEPLLAGVALEPHLEFLDWVIIGGESGPGARPCNIAWIRALVAECKAAGTPVFVKQLGSRVIQNEREVWREHGAPECWTPDPQACVELRFRHAKAGDPREWPEDLRVREFPTSRAAKEAR